MRTITLHPVSILVGAALVGAFMLVSSAMQASAATVTQGAALARPVSQVPLTIDNDVSVLGVPNPKTAVVVYGGSPYVVPAGKRLVVTGLGFATHQYNDVVLRINGIAEVAVSSGGSASSAVPVVVVPTIVPLAQNLVVSTGYTVTLTTNPLSEARAWGYLIDA
jgi:hypothetical protein